MIKFIVAEGSKWAGQCSRLSLLWQSADIGASFGLAAFDVSLATCSFCWGELNTAGRRSDCSCLSSLSVFPSVLVCLCAGDNRHAFTAQPPSLWQPSRTRHIRFCASLCSGSSFLLKPDSIARVPLSLFCSLASPPLPISPVVVMKIFDVRAAFDAVRSSPTPFPFLSILTMARCMCTGIGPFLTYLFGLRLDASQ